MADLVRIERLKQRQQRDLPPQERIGRCAIRVSLQGRRGRADENGRIRARFLSPDIQRNAADDFFGRQGIRFDAEASWRLKDIDQRARREGSWHERPGLQQHLADAHAGLFTDIAFYRLSRMARNPKDGHEIAKAFYDAGVSVHFIMDQMPSIDTLGGGIVLQVMLSIAQAESDALSDGMSDAILTKWESGIPHGPIPTWIKLDPDGTQVPHPEKWQTMRRLVELALEGRSYKSIARRLAAEGHTTRYGCDWRHSDINDMLSPNGINTMLGHARSGPVDLQGKTIDLRDVRLPLISEAEASALRLLYDDERPKRLMRPIGPQKPSFTQGGMKGTKGSHRGCSMDARLLGGLLICSRCHRHMTANIAWYPKGKVVRKTYECVYVAPGVTIHSEIGTGVHVFANMIDQAVWRAVRAEVTMPPVQIPSMAVANEASAEVEPPTHGRQQRRKKERTLDVVEAEIERLTDLMVRGVVAGKAAEARMTKLREECVELAARSANVSGSPDSVTVAVLADAAEQAAQEGDADAGMRLLVRSLVDWVSYPHDIEGEARLKRRIGLSGGIPRVALVRMRSGRAYWAPVYTARHIKEKIVLPVEGVIPMSVHEAPRSLTVDGANLLLVCEEANIARKVPTCGQGTIKKPGTAA